VRDGAEPVQLTFDNKPEVLTEKNRILKAGGRIQAFKDQATNEDMGPLRVWLPDQDLPGLAMSRSLGDALAHSVGVTSVPELTEFLLTKEDRFVVIATDGVWEFLSNQEVAQIVYPYYIENQPEAAANALVRASH
jgi:serine/threonine protein phosphatase PrpC